MSARVKIEVINKRGKTISTHYAPKHLAHRQWNALTHTLTKGQHLNLTNI